MKPIDCVPEEALGDVLALPASDPRRAHLDTCPRCRALVLSYEAFLSPDPEHAALYGAAEKQALDAERERLLGTPSGDAGPAAGRRRGEPTGTATAWWTPLFAPRLRPAWALAAVAVVATLVVLLPRGRDAELGREVRGLADRPLALAEPVFDAGSVRLAWRGAAGAERYEVRFFSAALEPVASVDAGADTTVSVTAERLPAAFGRGELVLYRVVALLDGDELAVSETRPLQER